MKSVIGVKNHANRLKTERKNRNYRMMQKSLLAAIIICYNFS